jgi:hypothetical protein
VTSASLAFALLLALPDAPAAAPVAAPVAAPATPALLVVVGASGAPEYAARFREAAEHWRKAGQRAGAAITVIGLDAGRTGDDRGSLQTALAAAARSPGGPVWLVFIGHGTYDGRAARFNLRGPDLSGPDLAAWLKPLRRPLIFVHSASASAPFIKATTGPGRIIVTATKTGAEQNATRFGLAIAQAIADTRADLDRDGAVSLLEAFLHAAKRVESSFAEDGLLATEHALLEDNGDGFGTAASFFRGLAAVTPAVGDAARDGDRARQVTLVPAAAEPDLPPTARRRRDELELAVAELRDRRQREQDQRQKDPRQQDRAALSDAAYYARLEKLLLELARIYRSSAPSETATPAIPPKRPAPESQPPSRGNKTSASTR